MTRPFAAAVLLLAPAAAWGGDGPAAPARPALRIGGGVPNAPSGEAGVARTPSPWGAAGPLALVLGLFAAAATVYSKTAGKRRAAGGGACEVLSKLRLEPRATVHVVRVGRRVLVVGSGADGLRTLSEIADPAEADALAAACRAGAPAAPAAAGRDSFRTLFGRAAQSPPPAAAPPISTQKADPPDVSAAERRLAARLRPAPLEAAA